MLTGKHPGPGDDPFVVSGRMFRSRLMTGTGKFPSAAAMRRAVEASGCHIVTVALRRVDFEKPQDDMLAALAGLDILVLPNTSGAKTADEAVRLARLARASGMEPWIKLEVTPDPRNLLPDVVETLKAAEVLVKDGFTVLPYVQADPILAKRLEEAGCAAVMPLGSPIGSNLGILARESIEMIIADATVPVVVDAGLGAPSHAAMAMEMGADAVLVNTAIATADDPAAMASAFRLAVEAGRGALLAGFSKSRGRPDASSPLTGFLSA